MRRIVYLGWMLMMLASPMVQGQQGEEIPLFDRVSALRLEIERLEDARRSVIQHRDDLTDRLEALARKIQERKDRRSAGSFFPDFTLQSLLGESQEVSDRLSPINRELDALKTARNVRLQKLNLLYKQLVVQTAAAIQKTSGDRRAALIQVLARLRTESTRVRQELLPSRIASPPLETTRLLASIDPDELAERADAVRDEQVRLRKRLSGVDGRIAELQAELRLERQMRDFQEDQALFGEESRILQVSRTSQDNTYSDRQSGEVPTGDGVDKHGEQPSSDPDAQDGDLGFAELDDNNPGECTAGNCGTPAESGGGSAVNIEIQEGKVPVSIEESQEVLDGMSPAQQLHLVRHQRQEIIKQIKKLQILYDRILEKSESLLER